MIRYCIPRLALTLFFLSPITSFTIVHTQRSASSYSVLSAVTIERPTVAPRPAVDEETVPVRQDKRGQYNENWEVRIFNDGLNTREHVARSLVTVTGIPELQAYRTMMHAHTNGMASVGCWVYEIAELYHDALRDKGIICDLVPVDEQQ